MGHVIRVSKNLCYAGRHQGRSRGVGGICVPYVGGPVHPPVEKQMTRSSSSQLFGTVMKRCVMLYRGSKSFDCVLVQKELHSAVCVCDCVVNKKTVICQ